MSTPIVPARPSRSTAASGTTSDLTPSVPPRPIRKLDPSPNRAALSPFNELPPGGSYAPATPSKLSVEDTPARPPSVTLPSIGQEGSEYAYGLLPPEVPGITNPASAELGTPEQTRNVSRDTPLHAPTASLPQSTAKSRIETVTQTNSTQAAAAGIGKVSTMQHWQLLVTAWGCKDHLANQLCRRLGKTSRRRSQYAGGLRWRCWSS